MSYMYDVAIIGLGPAGATLARCLDKSLKVIAINLKLDENNGLKRTMLKLFILVYLTQ